jgi:hypothetical protein
MSEYQFPSTGILVITVSFPDSVRFGNLIEFYAPFAARLHILQLTKQLKFKLLKILKLAKFKIDKTINIIANHYELSIYINSPFVYFFRVIDRILHRNRSYVTFVT